MKILISAGFGAGWTTWSGGTQEVDHFMLTHAGLIAAVEAGQDVGHDDAYPQHVKPGTPLDQFVEDFKTTFPDEDVPYLGGARDLRVEDVPTGTAFRITEYDGSESVEYRDHVGWMVAS